MIAPHGPPPLLADLAIVLGTAAVVSAAFERLRIPPILGYVMAGLVVGPHVPVPLVANQENVRILSELGVILLMFTIGLEFNARRLLRAGPRSSLVVAVQAGVGFWTAFLVARSFGWGEAAAICVGAAFCVSSTMIASRLLDTASPGPEVRELVFATLVIQDLLAILLLAGIEAASGAGGVQVAHLGLTLLRLLGLAGILVAVGLLLVPPFVRWVADRERDDALMVLSVGLCFTLAYATSRFGFSPALGAFLAGTLISESGRASRVERLVHPMRDLFSAIFFVSVGMLMDPRPLPGLIGPALAFSALLVVATPLSVAAASLLGGRPFRVGFQGGIVLGQVGEFSFIMLGAGVAGGLIGPEVFTLAVAVSTLTMLGASYLSPHSKALAERAESMLPLGLQLRMGAYLQWIEGLDVRHTRRILPSKVRNHLLIAIAESGGLVALLALAFRLVRVTSSHLESGRGWGHLAALAIPWLCILGLGGLLLLVIHRESRSVARLWMESAGGPAEGSTPGTLQIAVLLALGLPSLAALQPFLGAGAGWLLLASFLALVLGVLAWKSRSVSDR